MTFGMTLEERREALLARQRLMGVVKRRRPRRPRRVPPMRQPDGARAEYARLLSELVREVEELARAELLGSLDELVRRNQLARNDAAEVGIRLDDVWDEIGDKLRRLRAAAGRVFDESKVKLLAFRIGEAVSSHNKGEVLKQLSSAITIDVFGAEPTVRRQLAAFVTDNVRLIKSIPEQALNQVEGVVLQGVRRGARASEIAGLISERFQVSRSKATLIARDQVGKFNGELTQLRHQEVGVDEYTWRTSRDERVRKSHRDRDGKRFKWSAPPPDGHPGEPVQCRCTAEPNLDQFLLPEDRPS